MTLSILYDTADGTARALYPLTMVKVIAAIHWHALRFWLKVARLQPRPAARV
jgi:uncharacterized protein